MPEFFADLLSSRFAMTSLVAVLLLVGIAWVAARIQLTRRSHALLAAWQQSTRSRLVLLRAPGSDGFAAKVEPAPEPFHQFIITFRAASHWQPASLLQPLTGPRGRLLVGASFPRRPAAELIWRRGRVAGEALARRDRAALWVQRRLDVVNAEYVVRGINPAAMEKVFLDLQARFGPFLRRITVQADESPEVQVELDMYRFNEADVPALMTTLRALGRAAV